MRFVCLAASALLLAGCALLPEGPAERTPAPVETHELVQFDFEAPTRFGDWTTIARWSEEWDEEHDSTKAVENEQRIAKDRAVDAEILEKTYGVEALVEGYQRDNMGYTATLRMVATQASGYFAPASDQDLDYLGRSTPLREVLWFDDVQCLVLYSDFSECMVSNEQLTIWFGPVAMDAEELAEATLDLWQKIGAGEPASASTARISELTLPTTLGDYALQSTVRPEDATRLTGYAKADLEALAAAYGVDAGVAYYTSTNLDSFFSLYLVDGEVAPPYVAYADPERLGLAAPMQQRIEVDGAVCMVSNLAVRYGGDEADLDPQVVWCYLTEGGRTAVALRVAGEVAGDAEAFVQLLRTVL
jgi:hypothetical protein